MDVLMLVIATLTLAILLWQEWRRHHDRPRPQIDVETLGWITDSNEVRWELVQVSNSGNASAVMDSVTYHGVKVLSSGKPDPMLAFNVPRVLEPGVHAKLAMQGDGKPFADGWMRFMWHIHGETTIYLQWSPVAQNSALADLESRQWERLFNRNHARRRPKFWTRTYWRDTLSWKPVHVAPVEDGAARVRITERRRRKHDNVIGIAVADDIQGGDDS